MRIIDALRAFLNPPDTPQPVTIRRAPMKNLMGIDTKRRVITIGDATTVTLGPHGVSFEDSSGKRATWYDGRTMGDIPVATIVRAWVDIADYRPAVIHFDDGEPCTAVLIPTDTGGNQ